MIWKCGIFLILAWLTIICCQEAANNELPEQEDDKPESKRKQIYNLGSFLGLNSSVANETEEPIEHYNTPKIVQCLKRQGSHEVQLVNDTELIKLLLPDPNVTSRDYPATCVLVLFYSKFCPFSAQAAPHYNAMARAFPDIKVVAINAMIYHIFNTQNGIVGVPSILLFHNGKPISKYNDSKYSLDLFSNFIKKTTGLRALEKKCVSSADFGGPVYSVTSAESDTLLILSWIFVYICACYFFVKSRWWSWIVETIQKYWRESEAHAEHEQEHEHAD